MDDRIEIWQVLHDGEITVVRQDGKHLTIFVSIPYVRERIAALGDSVVLHLYGLSKFELLDSSGNVQSNDPVSLSEEGYEILSTTSDTLPVTVKLSMGSMRLEFERIEVALDTGATVAISVIADAHDSYWREFEANVAALKSEKR